MKLIIERIAVCNLVAISITRTRPCNKKLVMILLFLPLVVALVASSPTPRQCLRTKLH